MSQYQTKTNDLPFENVELKHGIIIKGERIKTARVRMSLASDRRNLKSSDTVTANLEYYAKLVTFPGVDITTIEMVGSLTDHDYGEIMKASALADELEIDPKASSGTKPPETA
jgi:hypothetical protein